MTFKQFSAGLFLFAQLSASYAADRFTKIVEEAGDPIGTAGGYVINQKRVAVQKELTQRPPTPEEVGVKLPPGAKLMLTDTSRQIAQYHPVWRIYEYSLNMPRDAVIAHFEGQGLTYDPQRGYMRFSNAGGDFIDGLSQQDRHLLRVWRKPR